MPETRAPIANDAAWHGPDLADRPDMWTHVLSPAEAAELVAAARALDATVEDLLEIGPDTHALPVLGPSLARLRRDILFGRGFALVRGLPLGRLDDRQAAIAFWLVGMRMGDEPVPQNAKGHVLGHVRDLGYDPTKPSARGYQSSDRLPYHCDGGDVVGLLSLTTPRDGGLSTISSSVTIYNEMLRRRPDLAEVLTRPLFRDRRDEVPEGMGPWYAIPAFNPKEGRLFTTYVRSTVRKAQRFPDVPRLTEEQEEAMDLFDALAQDPALRLEMDFAPGDMQFLCNHWIVHSRTAFEDWEEPERKRHLLRFWLACDDAPAIPEVYFDYQVRTAGNRPGGIIAPGGRLTAPLEVEDGGAGDGGRRRRDAVA